MRVFKPKIIEDGDEVCVSARVEVSSAKTELPNELWFRFPISCINHVSDHLNGFAAALLPLAMMLGEDLYLEGVLSPHLLMGMEEYQRIQCAWKPTSFKPVSIGQDQLQAAEVDSLASGVGCSFSGGVDSFHTLKRHLPENERNPSYRISHCLIINGFDPDSDIESKGHFLRIQKLIEPILMKQGVELIVCRTNYMSFSDAWITKQSFAALVTAPALVLGRLFSCFFVPSSYRFDDFFRDGSHLMLDHLISTESMETIHDSSHLYRSEKTAAISDWSATYSTLRVCFNKTNFDEETNSVQNCCKCEKCIRTLKTLEIQGKLGEYTVFPKKPSHLDVWKLNFKFKGTRVHAREVMSMAWTAGKWDIWFDYCIAIATTYILRIPKSLLWHTHTFLKERSEFYAVHVHRLFPNLYRTARRIR